MRPYARTAWHLGLLALAGVACYANAMHVPFTFDDEGSIGANQWIGTWAQGPTEPPTRRVAYLSFKLNYLLGGLEPAGYHALNVAIHVLTGFAVYCLARTVLASGTRGIDPDRQSAAGPALLGALLFVVHPIQTQAVTYVVQRIASLAAMFYVASLALYAVARTERPRRVRIAAYAAALAAAALGMRSKETAFTLPFALALLEATFFGGRTRTRVLLLAPFLALLPVIPALTLVRSGGASALEITGAEAGQHVLSRLDYLATESRVVLAYLRLLLLPIGQNVDHDYPEEHGFASPAVAASSLAIALLVALGAALARRRSVGGRAAGFGALLFFLALAVESSLMPIADVMFEHRIYLPSAGAALAVAGGAHALIERRPRSARWVAAVGGAWAVALGAATVLRNEVWRDPVALWRDVTAKSPRKPRGHFNLGNALRDAGDLDGAVASWSRVVELEPSHPLAWLQLGNAAYVRGDYPGAEAAYRRALSGPVVNADAVYDLALVLEATGRMDEALAFYRKFVEGAPAGREREVESLRARFGWR